MADREEENPTAGRHAAGPLAQAVGSTGRKERRGRDIPWCRLIPQLGKRYAPWLIVRANYTDMGFRPLPANTPFWNSPDIWVESTDPYGNAVAGEPNFVHARVSNIGRAPAYPTRVQFYWGDPSIGLNGSNMHLIGTEWVYIDQMSSLDVRCRTPWVPVMVNGGHECLIVNTSAPMLDPITSPYHSWLDRHVGQRNMHVVQASGGQQLTVKLAANNVLPMLARTQFAATVFRLRVDREAAQRVSPGRLEDALAYFGVAPLNTARELSTLYEKNTAEGRMAAEVAQVFARKQRQEEPVFIRPVEKSINAKEHVRVRLGGEVSKIGTIPFGEAGRLFEATGILSRERRLPGMAGEVRFPPVNLQPGEARTLKARLLVPRDAEPGEFIVMHVVQRMEAIPIGGYTVIAMVV